MQKHEKKKSQKGHDFAALCFKSELIRTRWRVSVSLVEDGELTQSSSEEVQLSEKQLNVAYRRQSKWDLERQSNKGVVQWRETRDGTSGGQCVDDQWMARIEGKQCELL